jgi:hypothetical protein
MKAQHNSASQIRVVGRTEQLSDQGSTTPRGAHVFEEAEIQIWEQILDPCLLLDSGLRDYEIKLDRRISAARESLQLFLFGN